MTDKKTTAYDAEFLFNVANAIVEQNDENTKSDAVTNAEQRVISTEADEPKNAQEGIKVDPAKLDAEQREFLAALENPKNINLLSDAEIKQLYKALKEKYYADKQDKKYFKKVNKNVKAMIKSDAKRTSLRHVKKAGKYVGILGIVGGTLKAFADGFYPVYIEIEDMLDRTLNDYVRVFNYNNELLHQISPTGEALIIAGAIGIAAYAGSKVAIKVQDIKKLKRLSCKVLAEDLEVSDVIRLKKSVNEMGINDVIDFYPLNELCGEHKQNDAVAASTPAKEAENKTTAKAVEKDEMEK